MLIKRTIFPDLLRHMDRKEISLIVGPRQAGKTTLMKLLEQELIKKGERTLFMSLDFERDMSFFRTQHALIERLNLEFGSQQAFVFIDEIQRKKDAGLFMKGIYDMDLPYKLSFLALEASNLQRVSMNPLLAEKDFLY